MELFKEPVEIVMSEEDIARVRRLMADQGIVDAFEGDLPNNPEHNDERWLGYD